MLQRFTLIALLVMTSLSHAEANAWVDRPDVQTFIDEMSSEHGFNRERLVETFNHVSLKPSILGILEKPSTSRPYYEFRPKFVNDKNVAEGAAYWRKNAALLDKISAQYQVEPEYLVAILGIETQWGRNTGTFRVMDALSTIAFDYPRRAEFFRKELKEFLLLAREESADPFSFRGSYAGAMGMPQFMPSSFHNFAQDWDGDHHRDIWKNQGDTLASVANYFAKHGWKAGESLVVEAKVSGDDWQKLVEDKFNLHYTVKEIAGFGVEPKSLPAASRDGMADALAVLAPLETEAGVTRYWLGLNNFYVITRYNRSTLYAMAVYEMAGQIRAAYERPAPPTVSKPTAKAKPAHKVHAAKKHHKK